MKKLLALVCAIACIMLLLCSCEPKDAADNTANYGTYGVYYEHYNIRDNSDDGLHFQSIMDSVLFPGINDEDYSNYKNYDNERTVGDFVIGDYYSDDNNYEGVCILSYIGDAEDIIIPAQLDGQDVVALGAGDYFGDYGIRFPFEITGFRSLTLPSTLKYIYYGALTFRDSVFVSEQHTENSDIVLPECINVDSDNEYFSSENGILFSKDKSCLLYVPTGIKADTISTQDDVKYIAEDAIICENVKYINIGKNVVGINYPSFIFSKKLERIYVDEQNEYYSSKDGVLFDKDQTILLNYPSMKQEQSYTLPDSVETVAADWGYVLKTEEIVFNKDIQYCNIYEQPYAYSEYCADGVAWYSSIKKISGYRGSGFNEAVYRIRSDRDIDYEYIE